MKAGFYPRLAAGSIRKNKRTFTPFILTCTGMVMMFYIIMYLASSDFLDSMVGSGFLKGMFGFGSLVMGIFAAIFLFYTNSFLIRHRKKEFGLYNILGMGKRNIARILLWETLITAVISVCLGLVFGIAFSKLAELGLVNVLHGEITYGLSVSVLGILRTLEVFGLIFVLLLLNSVRQVGFSSAVSLLNGDKAGEKPPKGNMFLVITGILLLGAAYYIAVTIEDPIEAIVIFFIAVIMVIIATYLVMISGSVWFCRVLQRKKNYYYKPNHFISVSSMAYRMKRNGAGLASICVLVTMVLVTMAVTACLYFGEEDAVNSMYPRDINIGFQLDDESRLSDEHIEDMKNIIVKETGKRGVQPENAYCYRSADINGTINGSNVVTTMGETHFCFVPLADYNDIMGTDETLREGEALLYSYRKTFNAEKLSFNDGETFRIKKKVDDFTGKGGGILDQASTVVLIVPDLEDAINGLDKLADINGNRLLQLNWVYNFDTGTEPEEQIKLSEDLFDALSKQALGKIEYAGMSINTREAWRNDIYGMYGSLFYLGIIMSIVFAFAATLIIYYKQISEGYEDQARFGIMQKVGMTKREIRKSINSQLLTVFFLPLLLASLHMCFAFPIIQKLMLCFDLNNVPLFMATTGITVAVFAVLYAIVYKLTSNAYYKIVSGGQANIYEGDVR